MSTASPLSLPTSSNVNVFKYLYFVIAPIFMLEELKNNLKGEIANDIELKLHQTLRDQHSDKELTMFWRFYDEEHCYQTEHQKKIEKL